MLDKVDPSTLGQLREQMTNRDYRLQVQQGLSTKHITKQKDERTSS